MKEIETIKEIITLKDELNSLKAKEEDMKNKFVDEILEEEVKRKFRENVPSDLTKLYLLAKKKNNKYLAFLLSGIILILLTILVSVILHLLASIGIFPLPLIIVGIVLIVMGIKKSKSRSENKAFYEEYKRLECYENISIKDYHLTIDGHIVTNNLASYTTYRKDQKFYNPIEKKMLSKSSTEKMNFIQEHSLLVKKLNDKLEPMKKEEAKIDLKIKELADSVFIPEPFLNSNTFVDTVMEAHKEFKNIHKFSELIQKILQCFEEGRSDRYDSVIKNKSSIKEIVKATNEFLDYKYIPNFLK